MQAILADGDDGDGDVCRAASASMLALLFEMVADLSTVRIQKDNRTGRSRVQNALEVAIGLRKKRCVEFLLDVVHHDPVFRDCPFGAVRVYLRLIEFGDRAIEMFEILVERGWRLVAVEELHAGDKSSETHTSALKYPPEFPTYEIAGYESQLCARMSFGELMLDQATASVHGKKLRKYLMKTLGLSLSLERRKQIELVQQKLPMVSQLFKEQESGRSGDIVRQQEMWK